MISVRHCFYRGSRWRRPFLIATHTFTAISSTCWASVDEKLDTYWKQFVSRSMKTHDVESTTRRDRRVELLSGYGLGKHSRHLHAKFLDSLTWIELFLDFAGVDDRAFVKKFVCLTSCEILSRGRVSYHTSYVSFVQARSTKRTVLWSYARSCWLHRDSRYWSYLMRIWRSTNMKFSVPWMMTVVTDSSRTCLTTTD